MPNYKPQFEYLEIGGWTVPVPRDGKVIALYSPSSSTLGLTLHKLLANNDYVVPTGKKYVIVGVVFMEGTISRTISIYESTGVDGTAGEADKITFDDHGLSIVTYYPNIHLTSVTAGRYLNWKVSSNSGAGKLLLLLGYEVDP